MKVTLVLLSALCLPALFMSLASATEGDALRGEPKSATGPQPNLLYLCKNKGENIYTNSRISGNCQTVALPASFPKMSPPSSAKVQSSSGASPSVDFPRVSSASQKLRDEDRRQILIQELELEQNSLAAANSLLRKKGASQSENQEVIDKTKQHERNISALRRELRNLK